MEEDSKRIKLVIDGGQTFFDAVAHHVADYVDARLLALEALVKESNLVHCKKCNLLREEKGDHCIRCGKDFFHLCFDCSNMVYCPSCRYYMCKECIQPITKACLVCFKYVFQFCQARDCTKEAKADCKSICNCKLPLCKVHQGGFCSTCRVCLMKL